MARQPPGMDEDVLECILWTLLAIALVLVILIIMFKPWLSKTGIVAETQMSLIIASTGSELSEPIYTRRSQLTRSID